MTRAFALAAAALFAACNQAPDQTPMDASASCDLPPPARAACVDEGDENCDGCWRKIGDCCYGDDTILGRFDPLVHVCRSEPTCKTCCNECAALSCDELRARDLCPNPPATRPDYDGGVGNGWTTNMWSDNGNLLLQAIVDKTLVSATLDDQQFNMALSTPDERMFVKYLIECALPKGSILKTSYQGMPLEFEGSLGLAPEWEKGPCGIECQEWVTACMFVRNSYYGIPVALSVRGPHPAITYDDSELRVATVEEGAFWGNMFLENWVGWACRGAGSDPISTIVRRCTYKKPGAGYSGAPPSCWFYTQGVPCDQVCSGRDEHGAFTQCTGYASGDAGAPLTYTRILTNYMKKTELGNVPDASCP